MGLEELLEIRDAKQLLEHIEYALGVSGKPSKFSPRAYTFIENFLKNKGLDEFLKELSLELLPEGINELLNGMNFEGFVVFPADLVPGIVYKTSSKAHPNSLTPFHRLLEMVGRVGRSEKCVLVLSDAIDAELPKGLVTRMVSYRNRILKKCTELVIIGGIRDEKYLFRIERKVKVAKAFGKRSDGTFTFLAWFSDDGEVDPRSVPAILSGGILKELAGVWMPLSRRYELVRFSPRGRARAKVVTISNIEDGRIRGEIKERATSENAILGKGDVVVSLKGRKFRVGVIEDEGVFTVDPNTLGIKVSNHEEAKSLVKYMLFQPIKAAIEENICTRSEVPFIPDSLIASLPVPPDLISFSGVIEEMEKEYEETLRKLEEDMKERLLEAAKSSWYDRTTE